MATRDFWFPFQTGSFFTPMGNMRIQIRHTIAGVTSYNHDMNVIPSDLGNWEFPFEEIEPSSQTMRFPSLKMRFPNIGNIFESPNAVFDLTNQKYQTFVTVYIDGAEFWWGIIDYDTITYHDQYYDSGWKYREVSFNVYDRIAYFWWNDVDIIEPLFYADDYIYEFMDRIFALIGIADTATEYDTNFIISEEDGNSYLFTAQRLLSTGSCYQVYQFLKAFMMDFAAFIYCWDGKYRIVSRTLGSSTTIQTADLVGDALKYQSNNIVEYIKLSATKDWSAHATIGNYTHFKSYGNSGAESARKFEYTDPLSLLMAVFVTNGESGYYPGSGYGYYYDTWGEISGEESYWAEDTDKNYYTNDVESGMIYEYEATDFFSAPVLTVPESDKIIFAKGAGVPLDLGAYQVDLRPHEVTPYRLYKIHSVLLRAAYVYNKWFLTSNDMIKLTIKSWSTYKNFHNQFSFASLTHRIAKAIVNIKTATIEMHLRRTA